MTKDLKELYPSCLNFFRTCKKFTARRSIFIIQVILYVHNILLAKFISVEDSSRVTTTNWTLETEAISKVCDRS